MMLLLRGKQTACPELLPGPRAGQEDGWRPHSLLAGRQNFNPLWPQYKCGEGKDVCGMVGGEAYKMICWGSSPLKRCPGPHIFQASSIITTI